MIYIVALFALFFTACTPAPFKFKLFEYEMPNTQEKQQQEQKEVQNAAEEIQK